MTYDVIVLGIGGMGAAAAAELARRGRKVLGLEQFTLGHDRGSSHGRLRVIRKAYYEHPNYVPLVRRAYERWYDLEQRQGRRLLTECGCLSVGKPDSELIVGVRRAAAEHKLPLTELSAADLRKRFPAFRFSDEYVGVLEDEAGFLAVEDCVLAHAEEAQLHGADIRENETVVGWEASPRGVTVRTTRHQFAAERLVITAGPWAGKMLTDLALPLTVMRQVQLWFGPAEPTDAAKLRRDVFPIYMADTPEGMFYGLPMVDASGHKCARHYGGTWMSDVGDLDRSSGPEDERVVRAFLKRSLPAADGQLLKAAVCPYTLTPDRHFVIDVHPAHANVSVAAGFSGHGFKFASVVGEALADLADTGRTVLPIGMFGIRRFASK